MRSHDSQLSILANQLGSPAVTLPFSFSILLAKGELSIVTVPTCKLRLFTWICIKTQGRKEITPTCPDHGPAGVHSRSFGDGVLLFCEAVMDHELNHCTYQELQAERQDAKAKLSAG